MKACPAFDQHVTGVAVLVNRKVSIDCVFVVDCNFSFWCYAGATKTRGCSLSMQIV